jgi:prepilin peptidase CpaA
LKLISLFDLSLVLLTTILVFFDATVRRIPNWLILFGLLTGLLLNATHGSAPFIQSILGFLVGITVLFVPFALGWMGAGDVKYFGLVGAFLGVSSLPRVAFYSMVAAGSMALGHVLVRGFHLHAFKAMWTDLRIAITTFGHILPDPVNTRADKGSHSVPWGVAIGAGTIIAYFVDPRGRWAGF